MTKDCEKLRRNMLFSGRKRRIGNSTEITRPTARGGKISQPSPKRLQPQVGGELEGWEPPRQRAGAGALGALQVGGSAGPGDRRSCSGTRKEPLEFSCLHAISAQSALTTLSSRCRDTTICPCYTARGELWTLNCELGRLCVAWKEKARNVTKYPPPGCSGASTSLCVCEPAESGAMPSVFSPE